jgi:hypothetical protein
MNLVLAYTSKYFGFGDKNDYVVLDGGRVIGRIYRPPQVPADRPWFWTITDPDRIPSIYNRGYCRTREEAMAHFKARLSAPPGT